MNWIKSIENYIPYNEQEKKDKELILHLIRIYNDILTRDNELAHITSAGLVLNKTRDKVLMIHHNIYNSWAWTGGHADGEEDLLSVAIRETKEETGVKNVNAIIPEIFSIDTLPVLGHFKRRKYVPAHVHLSVAYLLEVDENELLIVKPDENSGVKWIPINEVVKCSYEPHMKTVYSKAISKIKAMN